MTVTTAPKRVQLRRTKGYRKPDDAIVVARPSVYGNPFHVDAPWMTWAAIGIGLRADKRGRAETAVRFYRAWMTAAPVLVDQAESCGGSLEFSGGEVVPFEDHLRGIAVVAASLQEKPTLPQRPDVSPLRGRDLACWCPLVDEHGHPVPCHADVLLEIANGRPEGKC